MNFVKRLTWKSLPSNISDRDNVSDVGYCGNNHIANIIYDGGFVWLHIDGHKIKFNTTNDARDFAAVYHAVKKRKIQIID